MINVYGYSCVMVSLSIYENIGHMSSILEYHTWYTRAADILTLFRGLLLQHGSVQTNKIAVTGPNPIYFFQWWCNHNAALRQQNKCSFILTRHGWLPLSIGCSAHFIGMAFSALESWICPNWTPLHTMQRFTSGSNFPYLQLTHHHRMQQSPFRCHSMDGWVAEPWAFYQIESIWRTISCKEKKKIKDQ